MALVITVAENDYFTVGDVKCYVRDIRGASRFKIEIDKGWASESFQVNSTMRVEILPLVFVSAGFEKPDITDQPQVAVAIEAPRHVKILRRKVIEHDQNLQAGS